MCASVHKVFLRLAFIFVPQQERCLAVDPRRFLDKVAQLDS